MLPKEANLTLKCGAIHAADDPGFQAWSFNIPVENPTEPIVPVILVTVRFEYPGAS